MFHYTVETTKTIPEAIQSLEDSLKQEKFGVLWKLDIQDTLKSKGFDFDPSYHILEVCNPNEAHNLLTENKLVGYLLPCKIVVYDDQGTTKIGMPKTIALMQLTEDESAIEQAKSIEKRLITCIDAAK
ncbi:DUF302 domain-containing protein [Lentibacillus sp. N15]|uniref:DUF302 domain-containing protein n=1 Tax=Lentibacillus songyuanensis TaxID=3136161 RepID=UPI0031BA90BC